MSQNPDTKDYIIVHQDVYCKMWCTSGSKKIDDLVQEMQLKISSQDDIVFEWIPYNQFNNIKEIGKCDFATVYLAMWKDGPLYYSDINKKYKRESNKKVALKVLYKSQNITNE